MTTNASGVTVCVDQSKGRNSIDPRLFLNPALPSVPLGPSMDGEGDDDVEDIFEDGLLTIFGDVKVSHGEPGETFQYRTPTG